MRPMNERLLRSGAGDYGNDRIVGGFSQTVIVSNCFQPLENLPVSNRCSCCSVYDHSYGQ